MRGIIFDFNGTMFFDTDKHVRAWQLYLEEKLGRFISDEEYKACIHGKVNEVILGHYFGKSLMKSEYDSMAEEKESLYRKLAFEDSENFKLAKGLTALLDNLKSVNIPITIATASGKSNMDFYFRYFGLAKWFAMENIVFDDGTFRGKPEPDIYLKAANMLSIPPEDCVVVEDSPVGITAAYRAGIGKIIAMATGHNQETLKSLPGVAAVIHNYVDFENLL